MLLLGAGAVSAQGMKTDQTPGVPAAQQNAPAEKMAPAVKPDQSKAAEKTGQAAPIAPVSDNKLQATNKNAPAGATAKVSTDAASGTDVKSKRMARHGGRHVGIRYAGRHHGPLYNSYRGDHGHRGYRGCRGRGHSWKPWLWC